MSGTATTFAYNGNGLRESRTVGGNTTTFTWDVSSSIPQVLDDGTFRYVYGIGRIAEVGPSTTTHYYLPDGLGSTIAITNSSGTVVNTYDYDVFGGVRASTGSQANEFKFTGEQADSSTGLEYLRARYYDPGTGRFLSKDRFSGTCENPETQNRYVYALNNPISRIDPSGLASETVTCWGYVSVQGIGKFFSWVPFIGGHDRVFEVHATAVFTKVNGEWRAQISVTPTYGFQWHEVGRVDIAGNTYAAATLRGYSSLFRTSADARFEFSVDASGKGHAKADIDPGPNAGFLLEEDQRAGCSN